MEGTSSVGRGRNKGAARSVSISLGMDAGELKSLLMDMGEAGFPGLHSGSAADKLYATLRTALDTARRLEDGE